MPTKITPAQLFSGIRRAEIHGRHRLEQHNVYTRKQSLKTRNPKMKNMSKLNPRAVEDAEFGANTVDRRGLRSKMEFRGQTPVRWMPEKDYRPDMSGFTDDRGAFQGGRDGTKKGGKKDYSQAFGVSGKKDQINPFPIKSNVNL